MLVVTKDVAATSTAVVMSLWKHECYRVIADRFVNQDDKDWFEKSVKQVRLSVFKLIKYFYLDLLFSV